MTDLAQLPWIPWVVLAAIILADKAEAWRLIGVISRLAERQPVMPVTQPAPPVSVPAPVAVPVPPPKPVPTPSPAPPVAPPPVPPPKPVLTGPFANAPAWFILGLHDLGFHETGPNLGIEKFIAQAHVGSLGDPWCAIWTNAKLEQAGIKGSRSASSQSFRTHPDFVALPGPALGCIVVYWRGSKSSGLGHVGFYVDETSAAIRTLGGNESDMVQIEPLPKDGGSFGLVGYYWPKSVALPKIGAIPTPPGSLTHVIVDPTTGALAPVGPSIGETVTGKMSWFGGPDDHGVAADEGLALVEAAEVGKFPGMFLAEQPAGTTGLARRLDPSAHFIAMRWDYKVTPRAWLQGITVKVAANGKSFDARPIDWGPAARTGRIADLSKGLMDDLGIETDDVVTITVPSTATTTNTPNVT